MEKNLTTNNLSIAIVDDHEIFRSGLKLILSEKNNWNIVIEAVDGADFMEQLSVIVPDIVLLDIQMPKLDGYNTTKKALLDYPELKIIALSLFNEEEYYYKMIEAGVKGFLLKNSSIKELYRAIEEVAIGNNYFAQELLRKIVLKLNSANEDDKLKLSDKEKEILNLICNGFTNKEISEKLFLSIKSIEKYRTGLLHKTETRNTAQLVMHTITNKLI